MKIASVSISNFRSIKSIENFPISSYQALVGENNSGKSNILLALDLFLSAGTGGIGDDSFYDKAEPVIIKVTFNDLSEKERKAWRPYMVSGELILEKQLLCTTSGENQKAKVSTEFHGYKAEPTDWFLSLEKIAVMKGSRPKWAEIVSENSLPDYFLQDGKCNKTNFSAALDRYLFENEVDYDEPDLSETQALGLKSKVIASLPSFYLLKAISDYSAETDKRSTSTTFRRLMADLSERIIQRDERYSELEQAFNTISGLLGRESSEDDQRLGSLKLIEEKFTDILTSLMPSVQGTLLSVEIESFSSIFARGVGIEIDDGIRTDVLSKGHGLQRCIIFTLLRTLILNQRNQLVPEDSEQEEDPRAIILAVEEPELYIHPQLCKLFSDVLREFSDTDQVIFITHSPLFVDASESESIAVVRKDSFLAGTKVKCSDTSAFDGLTDKKIYKGYTRFNPEINELFFAKKVILVEGPEDRIALTLHLQHEGKIQHRTEEIEHSIIVAGGKTSIPFFQRVLNSFSIPYVVLHDTDITVGMNPNAQAIEEGRNDAIANLLNGNRVVTFPIKLEESLGYAGHLRDQFDAYQYFKDPSNFSQSAKDVLDQVITG